MLSSKRKRVIDMKVLPGEALDGSGRVCIHLFIQDKAGVYVEPHAIHPMFEGDVQVKQKVVCKPTRGRLACNSRRNPTATTRNGVTTVTPRTDDYRAVTCPKCIASAEYKAAKAKLEELTKEQ